MPKSKNRKDHSKKVAARRQKINGITNLKKKQVQQWLHNLQLQQQAHAAQQAEVPVENFNGLALDPNLPQIVDVAEPVDNITVPIQDETPTAVGASGKLS